MGVLHCERNSCNNVMCNRCSPEYGYICDECFEELVALGTNSNIANFMASEKENSDNIKSTRQKLEEIFKLR